MTLFTWKAERTILIGIFKWLSHWISQKKNHSTLKIHSWGFPSFNCLYRTKKTYLFIWFNAITVHIKTITNKTWINITFTSRQSELLCKNIYMVWSQIKLTHHCKWKCIIHSTKVLQQTEKHAQYYKIGT